MRLPRLRSLLFAGIAAGSAPLTAVAQDIVAAPPHDLSVTVYRSPYRDSGAFDLNYLQGFALITETRRVVLPPGEHRLRFEGVADGIEPATALVTGLPSGVIEKNRDAALLSPSALINAAEAQQGRVLLARTDAATGQTKRIEGKIRSGADGGVVVETPDGIEGLRCSGLSETFDFVTPATGLSAKPTLSVLTRVTERTEAVVQLSYLSRGFDWSADYTASMTGKGGTLDLGAWLTLANGNGMAFPNARVQIVAGRLNKESGEVEPIDLGQPILARCWPQGSTSDTPEEVYIEQAYPLGFEPMRPEMAMMAPPPPPPAPAMRMASAEDVVVTGSAATQEDLGDLKLYRVPNRTDVVSRQAKQVRFLDKAAVPVTRVYESFFSAHTIMDYNTPTLILRTKNDAKNNLGIPLPSGAVRVFENVGRGAAAQRLLAGETGLRDLAINEETELRFESGPNVQVRQVVETREVTNAGRDLPWIPGARRTGREFSTASRIEVTNANPFPVSMELRLYMPATIEITKADKPVAQKNGNPIFRVTVPANSDLAVRYQTSPK